MVQPYNCHDYGRKTRGTRPPNIFAKGDANAFVPPQLLLDTKLIFCHQDQVHLFYFFYRLKSVITNLGWMGGNNTTKDTNVFVPPTFARHKVNLLSSSSVLLFFLLPKVSGKILGWMGEGGRTL